MSYRTGAGRSEPVSGEGGSLPAGQRHPESFCERIIVGQSQATIGLFGNADIGQKELTRSLRQQSGLGKSQRHGPAGRDALSRPVAGRGVQFHPSSGDGSRCSGRRGDCYGYGETGATLQWQPTPGRPGNAALALVASYCYVLQHERAIFRNPACRNVEGRGACVRSTELEPAVDAGLTHLEPPSSLCLASTASYKIHNVLAQI